MIGVMAGTRATAGRIDGGQDAWLPIALIVLLSTLAALGAGRLALVPAQPPAPAGRLSPR